MMTRATSVGCTGKHGADVKGGCRITHLLLGCTIKLFGCISHQAQLISSLAQALMPPPVTTCVIRGSNNTLGGRMVSLLLFVASHWF
jgi:hypothetical protein